MGRASEKGRAGTRQAPDSIDALLGQARERLAPRHDNPRLEAELLLAHALGQARSHLYAWPQRRVEPGQRRAFEALVARRARGEPIAYILGHREFWSLELRVDATTLIPRPETELLVELALAAAPPEQPCRVLDLGTGSGAVALAIAAERPRWTVTAVEASERALTIARGNRDALGLFPVELLPGHWYRPLAGREFDLIVSNPPYVRTQDPHLARGDAQHEPRQALDGGTDGLTCLREIIAGAPRHLVPGGLLLLEHGADQSAAVAALCAEAGLVDMATHRDLAGLPRVTRARRPAQQTPTKLDKLPA